MDAKGSTIAIRERCSGELKISICWNLYIFVWTWHISPEMNEIKQKQYILQ